MRKGRALEQLIAHLEKSLAEPDFVSVESPGFLADKITEQRREHDVLLRINQGHHEILIAIECRDRSRPVDSPAVEAFEKKCKDTGINKGVIVSASGFSKTARKKAKSYGLRCLDLEEALSFSWLETKHMEIRKLIVERAHFTAIAKITDGEDRKIENFEVLHRNGVMITPEILLSNAKNNLKEPDKSDSGSFSQNFNFTTDELILIDKDSGEEYKLVSLTGIVEVNTVTEKVPFRLVKYSDKSDDSIILNAAIAPVEIGPIKGELMIVHKEGKGGKVLWVPENPSK